MDPDFPDRIRTQESKSNPDRGKNSYPKHCIQPSLFNSHHLSLTIHPSPFIPHHSSLTIRTSPFVLHHSSLFPIAPKKYHSFLSIRSLWYRTGKISLFTKYPRTLTIPPLLVYSSLTVHHHYHSSLILPKSYFFQLPVCNRYW